jgi:two-component system, chemotaxis family, CheB/CheR fusion protein
MTNDKIHRPPLLKDGQLPIVGIGASAGGLEALEQFFKNMPLDSGMAFVVIQHLDPNYKGFLNELLQRFTKMPVITVSDRLRINPDCIYVIPPNKSMSVLKGFLHLFIPVESHGLRLPIDYFLCSLADDRQGQSIGIILSGMGSDGSKGVRSIKEKGGLVLVQDPASAGFNSMPKSAIETVVPDIVAPANELPLKLMQISKQARRLRISTEGEKETNYLEKIILLLRSQTGNDFSQYKKNTLYRRIERRMTIHQINNIASYVQYLQGNPEELEILYNELLIGVTSFFRDITVWNQIKEKVIPSLIAGSPSGRHLRAWVAGCSTGEEAYSLAMIFKEVVEIEKAGKNFSLQIFATDIDNKAVERARKGTFSSNIINDVSNERLLNFFTKSNEQFHIIPEIREMILFAAQNLLRDPPFTKIDLLLCRNLLIYFDPDLQKRVLSIFHYSLNTDAVLILGTAETTGAQPDLYTVSDSKNKIYRSSGISGRDIFNDLASSFNYTKIKITENPKLMGLPDSIQTLTEQLLLQQFSPSSVLVNENGDIIYITGSTGKYLEPAAGKANMNLFAMAREGLRNEIYSAFRKAQQNYEKVTIESIPISSSGDNQLTSVTIQQIEKPAALKGKLIVIFSDVTEKKIKKLRVKSGSATGDPVQQDHFNELQIVREELLSTREEMQTSQEELKSTNEELQSINEELQSANEELTTSREEMQSLNEELQTVNGELQSKIDEFARINNDMNNLLNSIEIATLFLDKNLKIRQYTPASTSLFKLRESDIGRLFTDQVSDLNYPDMQSDAAEVLRTLVFIEKIIPTHDGRWFDIRIMPYRTFEDKIEGLVITFIDITKSKQQEIALLESQNMLRALVQTVPDIIIAVSNEGKIIEFNMEAEKLLGFRREEAMNHKFADLFISPGARINVETNLLNLFSGSLPNSFVSEIKSASGTILQIEWTAFKLFDAGGEPTGKIAIGSNKTRLLTRQTL